MLSGASAVVFARRVEKLDEDKQALECDESEHVPWFAPHEHRRAVGVPNNIDTDRLMNVSNLLERKADNLSRHISGAPLHHLLGKRTHPLARLPLPICMHPHHAFCTGGHCDLGRHPFNL